MKEERDLHESKFKNELSCMSRGHETLKGSIKVTHCSLDLGEHHYKSCFTFLWDKSYTSILLWSVPEGLSYSFVWNIWSHSPFSSIFCVGVCTLDNVGTSLSSQIGLVQEEIPTNKPGQGFWGRGDSAMFSLPRKKATSWQWFLFSHSVRSWVEYVGKALTSISPSCISILPQLVRLC